PRRIYPASVSVVLDLRPDDWLQVRVFAQSGATAWQPGQPVVEGAVLFEHAADRGWVRYTPEDGVGRVGETIHEAKGDGGATRVDDPLTLSLSQGEREHSKEVWIEAPDPETAAPGLEGLSELPLRVRGSIARRAQRPSAAIGCAACSAEGAR